MQKYMYMGLVVLGIFILSFGLRYAGLFHPLDRMILDAQFRLLQREDPNDKIALISIDERSLSRFAQNKVYWPWPREFYHVVLDYLTKNGAEAVVFDILYDTPDYDRINVNGDASDNRFARSLRNAGNSVLAIKTTPVLEPGLSIITPDTALFDIHIDGPWPGLQTHSYLSVPIPKFRNATAMLGNTNVVGDGDGIIRRLNLFERDEDGTAIPSIPMAAYLMLQPDTTSLEWGENRLRVGDTIIPLQDDGSYRINWYKKGGVANGSFPYYSFGDVLQSAVAGLQSSGNPILPDTTFKDKVVFFGASAAGLSDIKSTPMSSLEDFPGMEILATVLNNLLDKNFIEQPGTVLNIGLVLFIIFTIVALTSFFRPLKGTFFTFGFITLIVTVEVILFTTYRYWLPMGFYLSTGFIAFTTSLGYKYFTEEREKKQLKSAFNQYVQPELVEDIVSRPDALSLGGEKKRLTVMFSDLAGFTSLSEKMDPEELVSIMNDYLGEMTDIIFEHRGTVDKFIGDAIMAFWGAPLQEDNHAILACRATLHMNRKLNELNSQWQSSNRPELKVRFGINTGEMIVGNMGSKNRFNYTVIGDSVNLAARLEPLNSRFGTDVLISEETYKSLKDEFLCRQVGRFIVKGKSEPVTVYELIADRFGEDTSGREAELRFYREGLGLFYERKWDLAKASFEKVLEANGEDGLSKSYIEYCRQHMDQPPGEEWDGTFVLTSK